MLDSIKLAILITKRQHARLMKSCVDQDSYQWCLFNPCLGDLKLVRYRNLLETDNNSFHRELKFDFDVVWTPEARLILEFSVPKFWYGHNIHLLYGWMDALSLVKKNIEEQFGLTRMKLPPIETWEVYRLDPCYAWRFPSQQAAQAYLDSLKAINFPWKKPTINPTSISFPGTTYTVKIYLKQPEFFAHDRKALLKANASLEWVNHLETLSEGVLRFELTLHKRWLRRNEIATVADIAENGSHIVFDNLGDGHDLEDMVMSVMIAARDLGEDGQKILDEDFSSFESGQYFKPKAGKYRFFSPDGVGEFIDIDEPLGFTIYKHGSLLEIIVKMITKFVGEGTMLSDHQVQEKLLGTYSSQKAARLTAFWVYIQRFGIDKAKATFGKNSYYSARSDLKKAGVDLIERPDNVVFLDDEFLSRFRLKAPSNDVTNAHDDFRDSGNVLNLPKRA